MNKTFLKIFVVLIFSSFLVFPLAQAADYVPISPLPNTTAPDGSANLSTYLPGIFTLLISLAGALAVVMIVIGGVQYLSTDAIIGKEEGKERITNALVGLLLAIASWLILNTINPDTLNFNLSLNRVSAPTTIPTGTQGVDDDGDGVINSLDQCPNSPGGPVNGRGCPLGDLCPGLIQGTMVNCSCPTCVKIGPGAAPPYDQIPLKPAQGDQIAKRMADKLVALSSLTQNISWQVTEAWKPTRTHQNICHRDGSCVDANTTSGSVPTIKSFLSAAQSAGIHAVYEVGDISAYNSLISGGIPRNNVLYLAPKCGPSRNEPCLTGPHFSLYP